jgi:hypothetical protein
MFAGIDELPAIVCVSPQAVAPVAHVSVPVDAPAVISPPWSWVQVCTPVAEMVQSPDSVVHAVAGVAFVSNICADAPCGTPAMEEMEGVCQTTPEPVMVGDPPSTPPSVPSNLIG